MGEGKVRYRSSFSPKNRSGSGEVVSAGTFPKHEYLAYTEGGSKKAKKEYKKHDTLLESNQETFLTFLTRQKKGF
jgi:hypothetical protein